MGGQDYDLISGRDNGGVYFFRNNGTKHEPVWEDMVRMTNVNSDNIDVGDISAPALADLDNDDDLDLTIGEEDGNLNYYENTGTMKIPEWTEDSSMFSGINVGGRSAQAFADLDDDGDFDLAIGENNNDVNYFENTGTKEVPEWTEDNSIFSGVDAGERTNPAFADLEPYS